VKSFDIIVSGGAMAGATLALALDHQFAGKLNIAVVEAFDLSNQVHPGFDARAIALSDGTVRILKQFDLWEAIVSFATPIEHVHISDRGHAGMTDIRAEQTGLSALGYVIELAEVGKIFTRMLQTRSSISLFCPDRIGTIDRNTQYVTVTLDNQSQFRSKLLVAADGRDSTCCEQLGHQAQHHDFEQVAIIANVKTDQPHQGRAFERFTSSGPVAMLPMTDNRVSMVWCVKPTEAASLMQADVSDFRVSLQKAFGWRLGKINYVGKREAYPLQLSHRIKFVSHRFAIVGNAAQTLHPIAGQGFNLGIRDVASLVDEVRRYPSDVGCFAALHAFEQRRSRDRQLTIGMTSSLVHIFSNPWLPAAIGRNLGLMAIDNFDGLNKPLLKRTLGHVPR
jgi:2-octaprenyl-6-methoxyphenol hydroxylase